MIRFSPVASFIAILFCLSTSIDASGLRGQQSERHLASAMIPFGPAYAFYIQTINQRLGVVSGEVRWLPLDETSDAQMWIAESREDCNGVENCMALRSSVDNRYLDYGMYSPKLTNDRDARSAGWQFQSSGRANQYYLRFYLNTNKYLGRDWSDWGDSLATVASYFDKVTLFLDVPVQEFYIANTPSMRSGYHEDLKVMEVAGSNCADRTNIQLGSFKAEENQKFYFGPNNSIMSSLCNKAIDVKFARCDDWNTIWLWEENGTDAQRFEVNADTKEIISLHCNKAVDVEGGEAEDETNIQIYMRDGRGTQQWTIEFI